MGSWNSALWWSDIKDKDTEVIKKKKGNKLRSFNQKLSNEDKEAMLKITEDFKCFTSKSIKLSHDCFNLEYSKVAYSLIESPNNLVDFKELKRYPCPRGSFLEDVVSEQSRSNNIQGYNTVFDENWYKKETGLFYNINENRKILLVGQRDYYSGTFLDLDTSLKNLKESYIGVFDFEGRNNYLKSGRISVHQKKGIEIYEGEFNSESGRLSNGKWYIKNRPYSYLEGQFDANNTISTHPILLKGKKQKVTKVEDINELSLFKVRTYEGKFKDLKLHKGIYELFFMTESLEKSGSGTESFTNILGTYIKKKTGLFSYQKDKNKLIHEKGLVSRAVLKNSRDSPSDILKLISEVIRSAASMIIEGSYNFHSITDNITIVDKIKR